MITTLHIKNIGIIDEISVDLNNGLNVLTGETGAGKTLIIDSLSIISGGRFSKEMIRKGEKYSLVEAIIYDPESDLSEDSNIIVSREVYENGKNSCKINGRLVTVSELKSFMQEYIDIHGQSDNQKLMNVSNHINFLDDFAQGETLNLKEEYFTLYEEYNRIKLELKKNYADDIEKQRTLDLLNYQLNEIEEANLKLNEDEELESKRKIIQNSEKIYENLNNSDSLLTDKAIPAIEGIMKYLSKISNVDEKYSNELASIESIYYELQEVSNKVVEYKYDLEFDEDDLNKIQNRLDIIYSLKRKYGSTIEDILTYKEKIKVQISTIENLEEYVSTLKIKLNEVKQNMNMIALKLHDLRIKYKNILEDLINRELVDLEMKNAKFNVNILYIDQEIYNENGLDNVEFLISTNVGEEYKPLVKIASGGEISRIMLAIKTVLSSIDKVKIMVFDEIDTGISGIASKSVAQKLKKISDSHQILCVTHSAVVAAVGEYNYFINKNVINNQTKTSIKMLDEIETINEIARISAGNVTEIALKYACELRNIAFV